MLRSSHENTLQMKQDDKFFSRLVSKESSMANPSFRVYYGGHSVAVPFVWESHPGTPKHKSSDTFIPPLTPPPSYYFTHNHKPINKHSRSKLLHTLLLRINLKKTHQMPSSPSSSSSFSSSCSSSSHSSSMSTSSNTYRRRRFLSFGSSFDDGEEMSKGSMLCFGINRVKSGSG